MEHDDALAQLERFATEYRSPDLRVHRAKARLGSMLDGEEVVRLALLLSDPDGDTWDLDESQAMLMAIWRKAAELGLPWVSVSLVGESEIDEVDVFSR